MSKFRFYEFHPQIYPRRLWVAAGGTFEDIKARFIAYNGSELEEGGRLCCSDLCGADKR